MSLRRFHVLAGLFLLASIGSIAGCGTEAPPVAAGSSKYRPAGEGETPPTEATAAAPGANASSPAFDPAASSLPKTAPAASDSAEIPVPDGDVATLMAFIDQLAQVEPRSQDPAQQLSDFTKLQEARLKAVNKLLDKPLEDKVKIGVVSVAVEIFTNLQKAGIPGTRARRDEFAAALAQHKDADLAQMGRFLVFNAAVNGLLAKSPDDGKPIVARTIEFFKAEQDELEQATLQQVDLVVDMLLGQGLKQDALAALQAAADAAATSQDEKIASLEHVYRDRAALMDLDLKTLLTNIAENQEGAAPKLVESMKGVLAKVHPTAEIAGTVQQICHLLDVMGHGEAALECLADLETLFATSTDEKLKSQVDKSIANARTRAGLVGQPFEVEGPKLDGTPLDWSAYAGKVVLVDFWATWCGPCLEELPNILRNYQDFRELGFDVVGVNLDADPASVNQFLDLQHIPWAHVTSQEVLDGKFKDDKEFQFSSLPMAAKCGVDGIPFLVLVGKDGKVDSLHVRGPKLRSRLVALLGDPDGPSPADAKPAEVKPAEDAPAAETPAEEPKPAEPKPADRGSLVPATSPLAFALAAALLTADEPAEAPPAADDPAVNPYAAKPGFNAEQLTAYIQKMLEKPKTIQSRPGFAAAVCAACDRLLTADPPASDAQFCIAAESKLETLHKQACTGDAEADRQLLEQVEKLKSDERARVARQVAFFQQERKVLDAVEGPVENVADLLKELGEYYAQEKLTARHLRMASSTVALINRLEDGDQREEHFGKFGQAYAKSSDKELARYGKKLAKKPAATESDLVGQPLELTGTTAAGAALAWEAYRGKVVLVDFWATWCGPCLREMPHVKALHEKLAPRGFEVVGVSLDEDQEALAAYLEEHAIGWETLAGEGTQELATKYGVRGIPTMLLVDREGKILGVAHSAAALAPLAEKALQ